MTALHRNLLGFLILLSTATASMASERVIVILDASGSMWAQIDGKPRQEIARESLRSALQSVPSGQEIGFMAYGHREKASCDDIELIVPPATGTANAITTAADNLKFLGKTPLTAAVKQAAEALNYTKGKTKVILITDGLESCGGDPCALGKELKAASNDFTADVVGFGLSAEEGKQVACLAEDTGGKYIQASDENALKQALVETVAAAAAPEPAPAPTPEPAPAPTPAVEPAPEPAVPAGQAVEKDAVIDVGHVVANAYYVSGGEKADSSGVSFTVLRAEKQTDGTREQVAYGYGPDSKFDLPEGDYVIEATVDLAVVEQPFSVKAGEDQALKVAVNAGVLAITAPGANRIEIFEAKKDVNGNRKSVGYAYDEKFQPSVLAGDYVIVVEKSGSGTPKESTATVKAGERTQITVP